MKKTNLKTYKQIIKKFIYLVCRIKPDILFAFKKLNKYNINSHKDYFQVIKKIIYY